MEVQVSVDSVFVFVSVPPSIYRINCEAAEDGQQSLFCGDSERWWEQTDLTKLYLSSNQLTHLSEDIRLLPALTILDVSQSSSASASDTCPGVDGAVSVKLIISLQKGKYS